MKPLAVAIAAILPLALVSPALAQAQAFSPLPPGSWAYDAIADLADRGLIEGYPARSFRDDRVMTRYEIALVVARLLARIETARMPRWPADPIVASTIHRLTAEFRAELLELGVRASVIEAVLSPRMPGAAPTRVSQARADAGTTGPVSLDLAYPDTGNARVTGLWSVGRLLSSPSLDARRLSLLPPGPIGLAGGAPVPLSDVQPLSARTQSFASGWTVSALSSPDGTTLLRFDWAPWVSLPLSLASVTSTDGRDALNPRAWLTQLSIAFTPRTAAALLYEGGSIVATGPRYAEWTVRIAYEIAPNTSVTLNYSRMRCGVPGGVACPGFASGGDVDRFYRAELLYAW